MKVAGRQQGDDAFLERQVGVARVPLAQAGPLLVKGEYAAGSYEIPFASTERGLVACLNRGCKAGAAAGGFITRIVARGYSRAPLLVATDIASAVDAIRWIRAHSSEVLQWPEGRSKHVGLVGLRPYSVGRAIYLRLVFDVGDAMGGNATTILGDTVARRLARILVLDYVSVSSNLCCDKKPAIINALETRGFSVIAGILLPKKVLRGILRTRADRMEELSKLKLHIGSAIAGAPWHQNAHVANTLAGLFIALGQDVAQVVESSQGVVVLDQTPDGSLYASLTLPSLEVGVVGGGTGLPDTRARLRSLGCVPSEPAGAGSARLAEIVAAACLASELSLIASQASGHLAQVSGTLGRGAGT